MYLDFYGLSEPPFSITPSPRFLFYSAKHREAFNHLLYGVRERKGFVQLTGEVGAGKTTICRAMLEKLNEEYETALILNPRTPMRTGLMKAIAMELRHRMSTGKDRIDTLAAINEFLLGLVVHGKDAVLIIDEAQDLSDELLEQVRLLSNLETDDQKLLQIVLMGQPELRDRLNAHTLRQLRQRITVRYHLQPLGRDEMLNYIQHRIHVSGGNGAPYFSKGAIWRVHRYTRGIPRLINALCDKCLLAGFVNQTEEIDFHLAGRAIRETGREGERMSLINDALKKANQAQKKRPSQGPMGAPLQPVESLKRPPGHSPKILAVVGALVVGGGSVWSFMAWSGKKGPDLAQVEIAGRFRRRGLKGAGAPRSCRPGRNSRRLPRRSPERQSTPHRRSLRRRPRLSLRIQLRLPLQKRLRLPLRILPPRFRQKLTRALLWATTESTPAPGIQRGDVSTLRMPQPLTMPMTDASKNGSRRNDDCPSGREAWDHAAFRSPSACASKEPRRLRRHRVRLPRRGMSRNLRALPQGLHRRPRRRAG